MSLSGNKIYLGGNKKFYMKDNYTLKNIISILFLLFSLQNLSAQNTEGRFLIQQSISSQFKSIDAQTLESVIVTRDYVDATTNIRHVYAVQKLNGIIVPEGAFSVHKKNNLTQATNDLVELNKFNIKPLSIAVTAEIAIQNLFDNINYTESRLLKIKTVAKGQDLNTVFSRNESKIWDIPCRLIYYLDKKTKSLVPAWEVQMMDVYKKHYWQAIFDASSGKLYEKNDLITHCDFGTINETDNDLSLNKAKLKDQKLDSSSVSTTLDHKSQPFNGTLNTYRVFDAPFESPLDPGATHSLAITGGTSNASFDGWHKVGNANTYNYTRGNNVWAFYDPSPGPLGGVPSADPTRTAFANNGPLGASPVTEPFGFDYPVNLANQPETYRMGAITNLFYWNNLIHDVFYEFGFNEVGGNFESSHVFSSGLKGTATDNSGDEVLAQAQDGGGTNNANFLTQPDGVGGQMQMYLWTGSLPDSMLQISHSTTGVPADSLRYFAIQGSFNTNLQTDLYTNPVLHKNFVIVQKNAISTVGTSSQGCSSGQMSVALAPSNVVTNQIVLIDRGGCSFAEKVLGAQAGGAAGVIIINNAPGEPIAMGGADAPGNGINIPAVMVSQTVGEYLKTQITGGAAIVGSLKRQNPTAPKRDGDLDNGVIAHEYGHGISSRLTGGPDAGSLSGSEQGGEGWSDFIALYMTMRTNDILAATAAHPNGVLPSSAIGNYVTYQPANGRGIRPAPYSTNFSVNNLTFGNIKNPEFTIPHGIGAIWCTMMYEMLQEMVDLYGWNNNIYNAANPVGNTVPANTGGNNVAMRLILDAIKIQPNNPTFIQERNAILSADTLLYNGIHGCVIWKAFAKRGLGFSAQSGTNAVGDEVEGYDLPLSCDPNQRQIKIVKTGPTLIQNGSSYNYTITVTNIYATPANSVTLKDTLPAGMTFISASPIPTTVNGVNLEWAFNLNPNETKTFTLTVSLNSATASTNLFNDDQENLPSRWTATTTQPGGLGPWELTTNAPKAFSGSKFWFTSNIDLGGQESLLTLNTPIAIPSGASLIFIHNYATEAAYDGGVVEISSDNGLTWTYLPANKFTKGGYNGIITTTNNPQIGATNLAAFSGASPGFITSIALLDNYAGMSIRVRFRMVSDATGGSVAGGGWTLDDVLLLSNIVELKNKATVRAIDGAPIYDTQGTNAQSVSSGFVMQTVVLPLALGNLKAAIINNKVVLSFSNENDVDAVRYIIERKSSNENLFFEIGKIDAKQIVGIQEYSFNDSKVNTANQYSYRVRVENKNGHIVYTNIAFVRFNIKEFNASTYPNPAKDNVNIIIKNPTGKKVTYKIFNLVGKDLGTYNAGSAKDINVVMSLRGFASGLYFIEIYSGDNTTTTKMVVSK